MNGFCIVSCLARLSARAEPTPRHQVRALRAPDGDLGKKVSSKLVIAGGDAALIIDAAEVVLDLVVSSVYALGAVGFLGGVAAAGTVRSHAVRKTLYG